MSELHEGFKGSDRVGKSLQAVVVDLISLSLLGKQAHWNIVGANFRDLHLQLDELVDVARAGSDEFAERMRALYSTPDGRVNVVARETSLDEFPDGKISTEDATKLVVKAVHDTVKTLRDVRSDVDEDDPATADMLHGYILDLEKQAWLIGSEIDY